MNVKSIKLFAVIGGSAAVSAAAIGVAILQGPSAGSIAGGIKTGVTVTEATAPSELTVTEAVHPYRVGTAADRGTGRPRLSLGTVLIRTLCAFAASGS